MAEAGFYHRRNEYGLFESIRMELFNVVDR